MLKLEMEEKGPLQATLEMHWQCCRQGPSSKIPRVARRLGCTVLARPSPTGMAVMGAGDRAGLQCAGKGSGNERQSQRNLSYGAACVWRGW